MEIDTKNSKDKILNLVSNVVSSYVSKNEMGVGDVSVLIQDVYKTFNELDCGMNLNKLDPAVPIKKSVFRDYIICLEDGRKMKMLKRYLKTKYKMTPEQYRERWGLPSDYPMVAPGYAQRRSELARVNRLGYSKDISIVDEDDISSGAVL